MSQLDWFIVVAMLAALLAFAGDDRLVDQSRRVRSPGDPVSRFTYGWLGGLCTDGGAWFFSLGLSVILAQVAPTTTAVLVDGVVVNGTDSTDRDSLLVDGGFAKILAGFLGSADYAGTRN